MLIDGEKLIAEQLALTQPVVRTWANGSQTQLTPVAYAPQLDTPGMCVSLDGAWRVATWPFKKSEAALALPKTADTNWDAVQQPGKVFYYDPEKCPSTIKNWSRVGLEHLDPEDGAVLRKTVTIPRAWRAKQIYLRFDAIYPAARVYLNGVLLGEHSSGLTPVEWNVTDKVAPGKAALVAVRLLRRHKFVKMDMPRHAMEFAGLAQSACFHATEPCQISEQHLLPSVDAALKHARLDGVVVAANRGAKACRATLTVMLTDPNGKSAASVTSKVAIAGGQRVRIPVKLAVRNVQLWNDEYPRLYTLALTLKAPGQAAQELTYRTGFRRFELRPAGPLLNGRPVKFRGVNHLTYHPEHGMYTPEDWLRKNLLLMKRANVNAIRTHFLGPRCLASLCDELGIYLLQELPIDWGTNYIHDPEWVGPALQRIHGGILRDRDHPSVMVWSVGNENMPQELNVSADGYNHLRIYDRLAKTLDPSRPTMFPPPGPANKIDGIFEVRVGDIADTHYSFELSKRFKASGVVTNPRAWTGEMETTSREAALAQGWSGVWFSSEYGIFNMIPDLLNAPYLSVIDDVKEDILSGKNTQQVFIERLRREWGYMRGDPACLGGAYFPWLCAGAGNNPWGWVVWGEDNDWGVVTADLLPKSFFWVLRTLFSPVHFPERLVWQDGQTELRFELANHYNAIDLKDCTLRTMMGGGGNWMGSMNRWQDIKVVCPPGAQTTLSIPIWNNGSLKTLAHGQAIVCRCMLLDPSGFRPITADIVVVPERLAAAQAAMPIGPDAQA